MREGDDVAVIEGLILTDDYNWWHLRTIDDIEGWAVEAAGWYAPFESASTSTPNPQKYYVLLAEDCGGSVIGGYYEWSNSRLITKC